MEAMTEQEFYDFSVYIKSKFGISLGREKKTMLEGRLHKVFLKMDFGGFKEFYAYLQKDQTGKADAILTNAVTTNHTYFMRENKHFEFFSQEVLPYWEKNIRDGDLRTWCAACSTGEEAYTLAMLIHDYFSLKNKQWDTTVLATDLSLAALSIARQGVYTKEAMLHVPQHWKRIYFSDLDHEYYKARESLKTEVIFRRFNLMNEHFPFKKNFHTIFCRNVMIYFDAKTRNTLIHKFYDCLEKGGYLFIGHSEVIDRNESLFEYIMPSVYRKG